MTVCSECNTNLKDKFITCDCGYAIHHACLYKTDILLNDFSNIA